MPLIQLPPIPHISFAFPDIIQPVGEALGYTAGLALSDARLLLIAWVEEHWPAQTGEYRDAVIAMINRMTNLTELTFPAEIPYADEVENMTGVEWTNPETVEHPMAALRAYAQELLRGMGLI